MANDFNNAAKIALVGQQQHDPINATLSFDLCAGASPRLPQAFGCGLISASNAGVKVDPQIVSCTAVTP
jgi:hypothetical protein